MSRSGQRLLQGGICGVLLRFVWRFLGERDECSLLSSVVYVVRDLDIGGVDTASHPC